MDTYKEALLKHKLVSVWGIGYLGYTEVIRLQSRGFRANVFDCTGARFKEKILKNEYPDKEQIHSWSERGNVQKIDPTRIIISDDIHSMFNSNTHVMSFPVCDRAGRSRLKPLVNHFVKHKDKLAGSLIIFQSVGTPGMIGRDFIDRLEEVSDCGFVAAFRNDWTIEEFLSGDKGIVLAANNEESLEKAKLFYDMVGIRFKTLSSIKEAELYENARNSFQYITTVYINQMALAYHDTDVRTISEYIIDDVDLRDAHLSIGAGGYKMPLSVQNMIDGSRRPDFLTLVREARDTNLSMILTYADLVKKERCASVTLLGISVKGNQKNIEISPSIILAEYLHKLGVRVYIDDPFFDEMALNEMLPFCEKTEIVKDGLNSEALFIMADHDKYKYMTQTDIDKLGISNAKIVIDNTTLFKECRFSPSTIYHAIGDGRLELL